MELHGRREIFTTAEISANNIISILQGALNIHQKNAAEITYLHDYIKNDTPISKRTKTVRPEINNKIEENHALEITNFKVGFVFGEPVQYIVRGNCEIDSTDSVYENENGGVAALNELMRLDGKSVKDIELAEWLNECGIAYRLVFPTEKGNDVPFETYIPDPRDVFVIKRRNYTKKKIMGVIITCEVDEQNVEYNVYNCYTDDMFYKISCKNNEFKIDQATEHMLGCIPVIEYINDPHRTGSYENVISLCDALNTITSNCVDGLEQDIQSFTWFNNCEITQETYDQLKRLGIIMTKSTPGMQAGIKNIKTELDQTPCLALKEDMYQTMLRIACVPDRRASAGGNTGQALIIGEGWIMAESAARSFERIFTPSEIEFVKAVLNICNNKINAPEAVKKLKVHEVEIKFTRNKTDNMLVKTEGLLNMLKAGIHPRIAISNCGLFSDPEQVYRDSVETLNKMLYSQGNESEENSFGDTTDISDISDEELTKTIEMLTNELNSDANKQ